jgi:hypothetical protein
MNPSKTQGCIKIEGKGDDAKWKIERNDKLFYWCGKCNRWSTTHWTKEHTGKTDGGQAVNLTALTTKEESDEDWPCAFVANIDHWDEPSNLLGGLPPFTCYSLKHW